MNLLRLFLLLTVCSACVGCSTTGSHLSTKTSTKATIECPVQLEGSY
jgi:hypothetical protein